MTRSGTLRHCATCCAVYRSDFRRCPTDGGPLAVSLVDPLLGETIGEHYVVDGVIGEGAMGRVYLAHHSRLVNRRYAVKVLLGDLAATEAMRLRFAREAENASRLDHPNIVGIVDYGCTPSGLHYLVMDFVEGEPLSAILQRGPLPADRVIRIAHQLCEGLDHAHGRGVIHRDLKPENMIVFGEPGRDNVRIADFGLALAPGQDTRLTTTGVTACTPAYAAPEQLRGNSLDPRVDLYGLGTMMFEMLSGGILPFAGDFDTSVGAKLAHDAPSVLTVAGNVPPLLVTLIKRLLARDPQRRPRSARAVIHALEVALHAPRGTLRSDQIAPLEATPRPPWKSLIGLFVGLLFVAVAIGLMR